MIILICCFLVMTCAECLVCAKYLKTEKNLKTGVVYGLYTAFSAAAVIVLHLKHPNAVYNYLCVAFLGILKCLALEDMQKTEIDKILSVILLMFGFIIAFFVPSGTAWKIMLFTAILMLLMYLFHIKSKDALGKGDVICIGAATLCFTFENVFSLMIYTLVSCLIYGIIQVLLKKISAKQGIAFVPFLVIGIIMTFIIN